MYNGEKTIQLSIPSEYGYEELASMIARLLAQKLEFKHDRIGDLERAIEEVIINSIEHGYEGSTNGVIRVAFIINQTGLIVEIQDFGQGDTLDSFESPNVKELIRNGIIGRGWGLYLVRKFVDELHIESIPNNGTLVRMKLYQKKTDKGENDG